MRSLPNNYEIFYNGEADQFFLDLGDLRLMFSQACRNNKFFSILVNQNRRMKFVKASTVMRKLASLAIRRQITFAG